MAKQNGSNERGPRRARQSQNYRFDDYEGIGWLLGLCVGAAMAGGACRVGLTRDGGALAVGIYLGDDYGTEYIRPGENLSQAVREISQAWGIPIPIWDDEADSYVLAQSPKTGPK